MDGHFPCCNLLLLMEGVGKSLLLFVLLHKFNSTVNGTYNQTQTMTEWGERECTMGGTENVLPFLCSFRNNCRFNTSGQVIKSYSKQALENQNKGGY